MDTRHIVYIEEKDHFPVIADLMIATGELITPRPATGRNNTTKENVESPPEQSTDSDTFR